MTIKHTPKILKDIAHEQSRIIKDNKITSEEKLNLIYEIIRKYL